nr:hypothetical protein [Deinococcus budaensis]
MAAVHAALEGGDDPGALAALHALTSPVPAGAAALALHLGCPRLAARWAGETGDSLTLAAAQLRLGASAQALATLEAQPGTARPALLRARAGWQLRSPQAPDLAHHARTLARQQGDAGALVAAATLLGEMLLPGDARAALRALAEGLKVAELTAQAADAHLLAVLAHAQAALGSRPKAARTAEKAMDRSPPRSPARVLALLALERRAEARAEAAAGELAAVWWRDLAGPAAPVRHGP